MVKHIWPFLAVLFAEVAIIPVAFGVTYSYTNVAVPGAGDTVLNGINNAGTVVGTYATNLNFNLPIQSTWNAFVRTGQTITTLAPNFAHIAGAEGVGINNQGVVIGNYRFEDQDFPGTFYTHGFAWNGSTYIDIAVPNGGDTAVADIIDNGVIVGFYSDDFGGPGGDTIYPALGFRATPNLSGGYDYQYPIDIDSGTSGDSTFLNGRNNAGQEVATYRSAVDLGDGNVFQFYRGVLLPEGDQSLYFPTPTSNAARTDLHDINNNGIIAGSAVIVAYDAQNVAQLYDVGLTVDRNEILTKTADQVHYENVQVPGGVCPISQTSNGPTCQRSVQQINDNGVIVGFYDNGDGIYRGFIGTPGVLGDYNGNGKVDAADYVLWRKGGPLQNEGDTPGTVNQADYTYWRSRYGATSGSGASLGSSEVPEPSTLVYSTVLLVMALSFRHCARIVCASLSIPIGRSNDL